MRTSANDSVSYGLTRYPVFPSSIMSRWPPLSNATGVQPDAWPSIRVPGRVSYKDVEITTEAWAYSSRNAEASLTVPI